MHDKTLSPSIVRLAGRNTRGRKHELLTKALHLLKAGCSTAVQMKIKEGSVSPRKS